MLKKIRKLLGVSPVNVRPAMESQPIPGLTLEQEQRNAGLAMAVADSDIAAIQEALRKGADINARAPIDNLGGRRTPLGHAVSKGHLAAVNALLEAGADIDGHDGDAVYFAAGSGKIVILKTLLEAGADADRTSEQFGDTPLNFAAHDRYLDAAKLLLAAGADPLARNKYKQTPAEHARKRGHEAFADYVQAVQDDPALRPAPETVGLDMGKRIAAMEALGKPLGAFTQAEKRRQAQRQTREAQRQAALRGGGI